MIPVVCVECLLTAYKMEQQHTPLHHWILGLHLLLMVYMIIMDWVVVVAVFMVATIDLSVVPHFTPATLLHQQHH